MLTQMVLSASFGQDVRDKLNLKKQDFFLLYGLPDRCLSLMMLKGQVDVLACVTHNEEQLAKARRIPLKAYRNFDEVDMGIYDKVFCLFSSIRQPAIFKDELSLTLQLAAEGGLILFSEVPLALRRKVDYELEQSMRHYWILACPRQGYFDVLVRNEPLG